MKAQVASTATAYISGTQRLLDALAYQSHRVTTFFSEVIRGRHPILTNQTAIRITMLVVALGILSFAVGSQTAFADGIEARVPESPQQARVNAFNADSAAEACHYLTFCRWGQGALANAPTPSIGFSSSPAMLLNVGSSTLSTWIFSGASFAIYGIGMLLMYATQSSEFVAPIAAIIDKFFADIMSVFTGSGDSDSIDIFGFGVASFFSVVLLAAVGFWVAKIIVGFISVKSPFGSSLGQGLKGLLIVLVSATLLIIISDASAKNHTEDQEAGEVAGGDDPGNVSSWETMSAGWLIIGAENNVNKVTTSLNDALVGVTGGIIDDGISSGTAGGNDTCYAYTNSLRKNGFQLTEFNRDSNLSRGTSGVVMQYDQLMYQVYFKLYQLSTYGSTKSASNSWCRYGETAAGVSLGEIGYFNAGASYGDGYGQYGDIFGAFDPTEQDNADSAVEYSSAGILVNDDGSWDTKGNAEYDEPEGKADVSGETKTADDKAVEGKQAIVAMDFLSRSSSIADRNYWAVCVPSNSNGRSSVNPEWDNVLLYNKLTTQVNNRNTNVFGYAGYMFGQLKDKFKDLYKDVADPTVGNYPELCQAPWAIPSDLQDSYKEENAGFQEIDEDADPEGVTTQDAGGGAPYGWNDVRGTNIASQVISFTGLVGSGDMKSEWHFSQSVVADNDEAELVGSKVGSNPALSFYMKSQGLDTAFLLLYAIIIASLVGYFAKIMIPIIISAFIASLFLALTILMVFFALVATMFYTENSFARLRKMVTKFLRALLIGFFITLMLSIAVMSIAIAVKAMSYLVNQGDVNTANSTAFLSTSIAMIIGTAIATWIFKNFMGIDMTNGLKTAVSSTMNSLTGEDDLKGMFKGKMFGELAPKSKKLGDAATDRMGGLIDSLFGKNKESDPWGDDKKSNDPNEGVHASNVNSGGSSATGNEADALLANSENAAQQGQLGAGGNAGLLTAGKSGSDGDGGSDSDVDGLDSTGADSKTRGKELILAPAVTGNGMTELAKNDSPRKGSDLADSANNAMKVQKDSMASHDRTSNPDQIGTTKNPFKTIPGEVLDKANRDSYGASKSNRSTRENAGSAFKIADDVNRSQTAGLGENSVVTQMATTADRFAGMRPVTKEQINSMSPEDRRKYMSGDLNNVRIPGTSDQSQFVYSVPEARPGFIKDNHSGMYVPNSVVSDTNGQVSQKVKTKNGNFVGVSQADDGKFTPNVDYGAEASMKPVFSGQAPEGVSDADWKAAREVEEYSISNGTKVEEWPETMQKKFDVVEAKAPQLLSAVSSGIPPVTNTELSEQAPGIKGSKQESKTGHDLVLSMSNTDMAETVPYDANFAPGEDSQVMRSDRGYENIPVASANAHAAPQSQQTQMQNFEPLGNGLDEYAKERASLVKSRTDLASESAKLKLATAFEGVEARQMKDIGQYDSLSDSMTSFSENANDLDLSSASESMSRLEQIRAASANDMSGAVSGIANDGTEFYEEAGSSVRRAGDDLHTTFVEGRTQIADSLKDVSHGVNESIENLSTEMHRLEGLGVPEETLESVRSAGVRMEDIQRNLGDSIYMFTEDYERGAEEISQMFEADLDRQIGELDSVRTMLMDSIDGGRNADDIMGQVREIKGGIERIKGRFFRN